MSYIGTVQQCAPNIQAMLADHFTGIGDGVSPDQRPFLQFVNNQTRTIALKQTVNPSYSKVKTIELLYRRPLLSTDVDGTSPSNCTTGDDLGNSIEEYTINTADGGDWVNVNATYALTDLHCGIEGFAEFFTKELTRLVDGVDAKVSAKTATQLLAVAGAWSDDAEAAYTVSSNKLQIDYQNASSEFNVAKFYDIADALQMTGFGSQAVIFGGTQINSLMRFAQAGCCANNGVELGQLWAEYGLASVYDRDVASAFGGQAHSVAVQPGAVALLTFNQAGWKNGVPMLVNSGNYAMFSIVSPKTGTPMDVKVIDDCGSITISVAACTKLVALPNDLFQTGDNYYNVRFVNKIQAV